MISWSASVRSDNGSGRWSIRGVIGAVLVSLAVAVCVYVFVQQWPSILESWQTVRAGTLLTAGCLGMLGLAIHPLCIAEFYGDLEQRGGHRAAIGCAYFIANVFRYIPGKVATVAALLECSGRHGLSRAKVFQAYLAYFGLSVAISLGLTVAFMLPLVSASLPVLAVSSLLACGVCLTFQPDANAFITRAGLRVLRRPDVKVCRFTLPTLMRAFVLMVLGWGALGLSFALIVNDVGQLSVPGMLICVLVYPAAYTAGILSLVAPVGFGVREGLLVAFLTQAFPSLFFGPQGTAVALSLVVAHRAVMTMVDIPLLAIGIIGGKVLDRRPPEIGG